MCALTVYIIPFFWVTIPPNLCVAVATYNQATFFVDTLKTAKEAKKSALEQCGKDDCYIFWTRCNKI